MRRAPTVLQGDGPDGPVPAITPPVQETLGKPASEESLPISEAIPDSYASSEPVAADVVPAEKGRVLLLEDDIAFQEIIRQYLAESGYTVVAVPNGGEGIRELLSGEFALILCDLQMPGLPGDMFYRAVERIRPDLCNRFVFMSGYRGDEKLNEYIQSIGCWLLRKPFPLKDLLALFAFTDARDASTDSRSVSGEAQLGAAANHPIPRPSAGVIPRPPAPLPDLQIAPRLPQPLSAGPVSWTSNLPPPRRAARPFSPTWLDLMLILAVVLGFQYMGSQSTAATQLAERAALETEWSALSRRLHKALATRADLAQSPSMPARIAEEQAKPRWASALADIAVAAGRSIELEEVYAREEWRNPATCRVSLQGRGVGPLPRLAADRFRQTVEESLSRRAGGRVVKARFEKCEDSAPGSAGRPSTAFVIGAELEPEAREEAP